MLLVSENFVHLAFIFARCERSDRIDKDDKQNADQPGGDKEGLRIDQIERPKPLQTTNSLDRFIVSKQNIDPAIIAIGSVSSITAGMFSIDMVMTLKLSPSCIFVLTRRANSIACISVTVAVSPMMLARTQFK